MRDGDAGRGLEGVYQEDGAGFLELVFCQDCDGAPYFSEGLGRERGLDDEGVGREGGVGFGVGGARGEGEAYCEDEGGVWDGWVSMLVASPRGLEPLFPP